MSTVRTERDGDVWVVSLCRPEVRNAVDGETARALLEAFRRFEEDESLHVAVLTGTGGTFCAGADLKAVAAGRHTVTREQLDGPMGPTRLSLDKPVIAAVEGHAVAGGLELATWCDLRVAARNAVFGVFCRRWGVPLIDGGTVRLPRLIGQSRALDMILTGRAVGAEEALQMGLCNRVVEPGMALSAAVELAHEIDAFPQRCMRADRRSALAQWALPEENALMEEYARGLDVVHSGETLEGAITFAGGARRHGSFKKG